MPVLKPQNDPRKNLLLSRLPDCEYESVIKTLSLLEMTTGDVLWEVGDRSRYVYFPISGLISLDYETEQGSTLSIALIGRHGMAGSDVALGNYKMPDRAVVVADGRVWRLPHDIAQQELRECGDFQNLFTAYASGLMKKIAQNAICNRLHHIDQQLSRLMLELSEELDTLSISITQERMAELLGIRRESVSVAMARLKKSRCLRGRRGGFTVTDRERLANLSCECYQTANENFQMALDSLTT